MIRYLVSSVDVRNKAMPVSLFPGYINHYTANVTATALPPTARFMEVTPLTDNAWVNLGGSTVTASVPSSTTDGSASQVVLGGKPYLFEIPGDVTHFAVTCSGEFQVAFFA